MDYLEHWRTFPNQRANAGPDQSCFDLKIILGKVRQLHATKPRAIHSPGRLPHETGKGRHVNAIPRHTCRRCQDWPTRRRTRHRAHRPSMGRREPSEPQARPPRPLGDVLGHDLGEGDADLVEDVGGAVRVVIPVGGVAGTRAA